MEETIQRAVEQNVLELAQNIEDQVDERLKQLENLEENDLEMIKRKRLEEMKRAEARKEEWLRKGHGELQEVQERDFFSEAKGEERVLCLFYRESWPCQIMEKHLRNLARCHIETKFLKIQAEKAPFLAERLKIWMLPTLAMVKNGKTTDYIVGLDELGGHEDFDPSLLEGRLISAGILFESACAKPKPQEGQVKRSIAKGGFRKSESDEDSDFD